MYNIVIMKLLLFIVLTIAQLKAFAQYTIFAENMGSTSVGASILSARTYVGYQNYNNGSITYLAPTGSTATIRNNANSSSDYSTASGGNYVFIMGNNNAYFTIANIPITGATNLRLTFGVSKSTIDNDGSALEVQITVDDGATISFSPMLPTGTGSTQWNYIVSTVSIPTGSTMSVNFLNTSTSEAGNVVSYRIDDISILSDTPLPVTFGDVKAVFKNDVLDVTWSTLKEVNNAYFDVQVSTDGVTFKTMATVVTKNENSDKVQEYAAYINWTNNVNLLQFPVLLILISLGCIKRIKRTYYILIWVGIMLIASCYKNNNDVMAQDFPKIFIRIKQVDVDGSYEYSKVVQAIHLN